jgi:hypothetical protein
MQAFIVLGIIPGTHIQTTLNFWIMVSLLFGILVLRRALVMARNMAYYEVRVRKIAYTIRHCEPRLASVY